MIGVVPARGGSKGLKGKNLALVDGKPLFLHAAEALAEHCDLVYIATDDPTIYTVAEMHGFAAYQRQTVPDDQTILEAVRELIPLIPSSDDVVLLQPTVPPTFDISEWITQARTHQTPVVAGHPAGHLMWGSTFDLIGPRKNRQGLPELPIRELGLYYWPAGTAGQPPTAVIPVKGEAFDVDTAADLQAVRRWYGRKKILIRYVADQTRGTGHVRRMLTLANELQHHDVTLQPADLGSIDTPWSALELGLLGWDTRPSSAGKPLDPPDLLITDTLDNDEHPMPAVPWVTFEDLGNATTRADLVINALYGRYGWRNERYGPDWCILRPEFSGLPKYEVRNLSGVPPRVLVMFGGTDPADLLKLTDQALRGLQTTVIGPGANVPVVKAMLDHDLLITSAGRTVYEAAAVGIPSIVLAQNNREATHVHLGPSHGNIFLGLGRLVTPDRLREVVDQVVGDQVLRRELSATSRRSVDGKGLARVVDEIERILEER